MIGQILNNRYTITSRLGKGAMGTVYRATDGKTDQEVAIKVIASDLAVDPAMLERFKREGEALRQLKHLNIVGFIDAFQHDEQYVIVMEYVKGGSLYELLKAGPLPIERSMQIALDLCDALIRSHRLKIIHRDIKPENILIDEDGTPKLADFGVARLSEGTRMTRSGMQVGTPYYMSPEAWDGKPLDAQADIWSLGVVLFEMLSGQVPFDGDTPLAVLNKVNHTPPPDLKKLRTEVPSGLVKIISRMLTRDKKRRYQTMREVAVDLERGLQATHPIPVPPKKISPIEWFLQGLNRFAGVWTVAVKSTTETARFLSGKIEKFISSQTRKTSLFSKRILLVIAVIVLLFFIVSVKQLWLETGDTALDSNGPAIYYTTIDSSGTKIYYYLKNVNKPVLNSIGTADTWYPAPDKRGNLFFTSIAGNGQIEIFVLDAKGIKSQFTHTAESFSSWAPAPDGLGNLYFASNQEDDKTEIYVIHSHGIKSRVTHTEGDFESWSPAPDGLGNLYFVSNQDGNAEIFVIDSKGIKSQVTHTSSGFESWSPAPDGLGNLYFVSNQDGNVEIFVIDSNGTKSQVTHTKRDVENWSPVPHGLGILYFTSDRNGKVEIFKMDSKGETQILEEIPPESWLKERFGNPSTPESME